MPRVAIITYSMYGHINALAASVKKGLEAAGCTVEMFQVPETLPAEVLAKMHAPPKPDIPVADMAFIEKMPTYDGFVFGFPTRFGLMAAQMKAFWDATGGLWATGALAGKPATMFTSTGSQGGGQETTLMTAVSQLAHHAMVYVSTGFTYGPSAFNVEEVKGGSAYGAGTIAGPTGARQPSAIELGHAEHQGKFFAGIVKKLAA